MKKMIRSAVIAVAVILLLVTVTCVLVGVSFRLIYVDGNSMAPTLESGEWIAASRFTAPKRGDIILTNMNNAYRARLIKRLIAFGGETVDIDFDTGTVYVDGDALDEPYLADTSICAGDVSFPLTVPEGCVFLLGDNRVNSLDSRYALFGCVPASDIIGPVVVRLLPAPPRFL